MKKIYMWEPWFFILFGVFHLHRIWALVDRESYASFWIGIMQNKGILYFLLMGILAALCITGICAFIKKKSQKSEGVLNLSTSITLERMGDAEPGKGRLRMTVLLQLLLSRFSCV